MSIPAHHVEAAARCNQAYSVEGNEIWRVRETEAWVVVSDCHQYIDVFFRGTEASRAWPLKWSWSGLSNTRDIIKDLWAFPRLTRRNYFTHAGFRRGARQWRDEYYVKLSKLGLPLRIHGHSLGAAIAVQAAAMLWHIGLEIDEVVVFGEPASFYWGGEEHYRSLGINTTSYLNANDWIRFAPPWGSTSVERTLINPRGGINFKAHDIGQYHQALATG